jgi:hypothetical protein
VRKTNLLSKASVPSMLRRAVKRAFPHGCDGGESIACSPHLHYPGGAVRVSCHQRGDR